MRHSYSQGGQQLLAVQTALHSDLHLPADRYLSLPSARRAPVGVKPIGFTSMAPRLLCVYALAAIALLGATTVSGATIYQKLQATAELVRVSTCSGTCEHVHVGPAAQNCFQHVRRRELANHLVCTHASPSCMVYSLLQIHCELSAHRTAMHATISPPASAPIADSCCPSMRALNALTSFSYGFACCHVPAPRSPC